MSQEGEDLNSYLKVMFAKLNAVDDDHHFETARSADLTGEKIAVATIVSDRENIDINNNIDDTTLNNSHGGDVESIVPLVVAPKPVPADRNNATENNPTKQNGEQKSGKLDPKPDNNGKLEIEKNLAEEQKETIDIIKNEEMKKDLEKSNSDSFIESNNVENKMVEPEVAPASENNGANSAETTAKELNENGSTAIQNGEATGYLKERKSIDSVESAGHQVRPSTLFPPPVDNGDVCSDSGQQVTTPHSPSAKILFRFESIKEDRSPTRNRVSQLCEFWQDQLIKKNPQQD